MCSNFSSLVNLCRHHIISQNKIKLCLKNVYILCMFILFNKEHNTERERERSIIISPMCSLTLSVYCRMYCLRSENRNYLQLIDKANERTSILFVQYLKIIFVVSIVDAVIVVLFYLRLLRSLNEFISLILLYVVAAKILPTH